MPFHNHIHANPLIILQNQVFYKPPTGRYNTQLKNIISISA